MSQHTNTTRRSFLKSGAILAAPLAAAAPAVLADEALRSRLSRLEDTAAIGELHRMWLRYVNSGEDAAKLFADPQKAALDEPVCGITADHSGRPDAIEIAANGQTAVGRFACLVDFETAISEDSTLAQMARLQGGGFIRWIQRRMLNVKYVKSGHAWSIANAEFLPA